jgi:hypothetical protein
MYFLDHFLKKPLFRRFIKQFLKIYLNKNNLKFIFSTYNEITPNIALGGPTNFAPLIYQAIQICQRVQDVSL